MDRIRERERRRQLIQGAAGALFLSVVPAGARAASLLAVRLWPAPEYTRVAIEHDAPLRFHQFLIADAKSPRLVVDIEGIEATSAFLDQVKAIDPADPFLARIRVGHYRKGVVRLVLDLKVPVKPQVFSLDPVGPYQHRLVLDLYPETAATDPLLTLLKEAQEKGPSRLPDEEPAAPANPAPAPPEEAKTTEPAKSDGPAQPAANATPEAPAKSGPRPLRRLYTIAIDPGHGGEDPGAVGRHGTLEKEIVLSISRLLAAHLEKETDFRVLMTRDSDYFVSLGARVEKARRVQADLFVSVHADAWVRPDARGASVFALSERGATSSAAAELARQQNDADRIGGLNIAAAAPPVRRVLLDLSTTRQIADSLTFGDAVLKELGQVNRLHRGYVEQAGFAVLKAPEIPSILVESAFLSNPEEEARLRDPAYQGQVALAIFHGLQTYFAHNPPAARNPVG